LSHRAGPQVPPVLCSHFPPFSSRFHFPIIQHHSASSSGSLGAIPSHDTHTHTHTLSLSLSHQGSRGDNTSLTLFLPPCASAPPSGSRTRIGHGGGDDWCHQYVIHYFCFPYTLVFMLPSLSRHYISQLGSSTLTGGRDPSCISKRGDEEKWQF